MSVSRANLVGGPCTVAYAGGAKMHSREDIKPNFIVDQEAVDSSLFGEVDKSARDARIEVPVRLWGAYENLAQLFPSTYLTPQIGSRICGVADQALVLHSNNQDRHTYHNAVLTRMANLFLGVRESLYAEMMYTALIKNNANPEDANAYCTIDTLAFPSDTGFAKTNFKRQRYSAAWGAITGFTAFQAKEGWEIEWDLRLEPEIVDGVGTVDLILVGLVARAKCIPLGPTATELLNASRFQGTAGNANVLGRLLSRDSADLVITGSGVSITLKNAGIVSHGYAFGGKPLRNGEVVWETTVGFAAGARAASAVVA